MSRSPAAPGPGLVEVLEEARELGFLGPGPIETHLVHAEGFRRAWEGPPPVSVVDLGSGAGVPALPLAHAWPDSLWLLVEANGRKARFLTQALARLGLHERVRVAAERAEVLGRLPGERAASDLVVARGFGPPGVTAECAAPLLRIGGRLLTSEPPAVRTWPEGPLAELGLVPRERRGQVMVLEQLALCPERFPRRSPAKRPLF